MRAIIASWKYNLPEIGKTYSIVQKMAPAPHEIFAPQASVEEVSGGSVERPAYVRMDGEQSIYGVAQGLP